MSMSVFPVVEDVERVHLVLKVAKTVHSLSGFFALYSCDKCVRGRV
jgi:hypothetical protein